MEHLVVMGVSGSGKSTLGAARSLHARRPPRVTAGHPRAGGRRREQAVRGTAAVAAVADEVLRLLGAA